MLVLRVRTCACAANYELLFAGRTDSIITDFLPDDTRIAFEGLERLCDQLAGFRVMVILSLRVFQSCGVEEGLAHQGFGLQARAWTHPFSRLLT